jgi:Ca2+-binding EF-hand superfamily protein
MLTKVATATLLLLSSCVALAQGRDGAMLESADADHDGKVTRQEFTDARAAQFARLDRNGDGVVDDADSGERAKGNQRAAAIRARLDTNSDGKISKEEFVNSPSLLFNQFDANHDEVLDAKELEAARSAAKDRLSERRQQ